MLGVNGKTIGIVILGLSLGGAAGFLSKPSTATLAPPHAVVPVFDEAHFTKAGAVDSSLSLARQLPSADAARCAALAKIMLAKRNSYTTPSDPFADNSPVITHESPLPASVWQGLFKRWMQVDPQAAWEFVLAHDHVDLPLRGVALRQWALIDLSAALAAAGKDITGYEQLVILSACTENDPARGLALMLEWGRDLSEAMDDPFDTDDSLLNQLLIQLAKKSPAAALEWCQKHVPDELPNVCIGWNRNDPAGCHEWIKSRPLEEQETILELLCQQPEVSPLSLRDLAALCKAEHLLGSLDEGLRIIATRDESLSQALIDELLPNPADRMTARAEIGSALAEADPRKAMRFILPSLRESMPLFEIPYRSSGCGMGMSQWPFEPANRADYSAMADVFSSYVRLGPEAGVGKQELLDALNQIHPQYMSWMLQENLYQFNELMGTSAQWLQPLVKDLNREDMSDIVGSINYESAEEILQDVKSLKPGLLRDEIIATYSGRLLADDRPVAEVMDRLRDLGDHHADLGELYGYWMETDPAAALKHFVNNPEPTANEWQSVIRDGFEEHSEHIQEMAEALPPGMLRSEVAEALAEAALDDHTDFVTSMYWATEISSREQRKQQMLSVLQSEAFAQQNEETLNGMRSNIEQSSLSAAEKAYWLDRMESEVVP